MIESAGGEGPPLTAPARVLGVLQLVARPLYLAFSGLDARTLGRDLASRQRDLCFQRSHLRACLPQLKFIRRRIDDEQRRTLCNILIIGHEDLDNTSTDFRRHRCAVGKDARIVRARAPIDREDDENAENDGESDCRRCNHFSAKRLAFTHRHFSRQPDQPHREGACTANR